MGPTWGPPGSCWLQMGLMLAPWTLLSGYLLLISTTDDILTQPYNISTVSVTCGWLTNSSLWKSTADISYGWYTYSPYGTRTSLLFLMYDISTHPYDKRDLPNHVYEIKMFLGYTDQLVIRIRSTISIPYGWYDFDLSHTEELLSYPYEIRRVWQNNVMTHLRCRTAILWLHDWIRLDRDKIKK